MESFEELGLSREFLDAIRRAGLVEPSEIQERAIPLALQGKDIIGGSATGSGKTLAFGAGIIEKTECGKGLQALVLTPTRELAEQVGNVFRKFSSHKNLRVSLVYGGVGIEPQINSLRSSEIAVGTPGRILDHIERRTINLSKIKILVLDEADRMLDMGFIDDVEKIIRHCPKERQTLLFSATISPDIEHIAKRHMINPESISVESYVDPQKLHQIYYDVPSNNKFSLLVHLIKMETSGLVMVFCNTRRNTDFVAENLKKIGIEALAIHGGLAQNKRSSIMQKFHEKRVYVLVCTDVAARGLDIKGVSHVYNYDIPKTSKEYIHRIGRTARAGKEGVAINILSERDYDNFRAVTRDESLEIKKEHLPQFEKIWISMERKPFGRRFGNERGGSWGGRSPRRNVSQRSGHYRHHNSGSGSRGRFLGGRR